MCLYNLLQWAAFVESELSSHLLETQLSNTYALPIFGVNKFVGKNKYFLRCHAFLLYSPNRQAALLLYRWRGQLCWALWPFLLLRALQAMTLSSSCFLQLVAKGSVVSLLRCHPSGDLGAELWVPGLSTGSSSFPGP